MIDGYFFRSLLGTLIVYFILAGALTAFVVITGIAGFLIIFVIIAVLLTFFYNGSGKPGVLRRRRKKHE
ncbi:MAG: hypothetical protein C4526_09495 [Nitrospiraceae bacterium]|nr:MAG: hypothetical protein C4526_09495 [Nitrospiraceae bacterium]